MRLSELSVGDHGVISDITGLPPEQRKRLVALGLLPNTPVQLIRRAPLGDPIQIRLRGGDLAIQKRIANCVEVCLK
ncbi:FeoA family protein [Photobacterium sp. 1_MG-2023]|uniref:FeoA family protein n=1 Tax=Photobacterium sp. 1_MG-2023 TaxID=3062646 RepID=UPI0026E2EEFA|nr:FeoA family protein [Photobacterium sp. 1_MG-2023]MDO6705733.1 FeoA family protein [Photobacterium sp. 1_MG-2023]